LFGGLADTGLIPAPDWERRTWKKALTPPPDALVAAPLFQTTSLATPPFAVRRLQHGSADAGGVRR